MPLASVLEWSTTASSNTDVGGVSIAEGMAPSGVNNGMREIMAQVATGLAAGSFIRGIDQLAELTSAASGDLIAVADVSTANAVKRMTLTTLASALVPLGVGSPVGAISAFAGTTAPAGWLLCYGQAISRSTYSVLFTAISTTYGTGDGSTTFNLPDLRGRVWAGKDDMGGTSANRLTDQTGGLNGDTLGDTGGAETHTLTTTELASHVHSVDFTGKAVAGASGSGSVASGAGSASTITAFNTQAAGSGGAHNNVQPTIIMNAIIYTGVV